MQSEASVRECLVLYKRRKRHKIPQDAVHTADRAAALFTNVIPDGPREHFVVLALDARQVPIGWSQIGLGSLGECPVPVQEVLRFALLAGAHTMVLGHNHPSGNVHPSEADLGLTGRVVAAAKLVGVQVLDHVIVAHRSSAFYSFHEHGLLPAE